MHDHGDRAGGAAGDRAGLLSPRAGQPARGDARPAADRGGLRRLALDRRAVPAVRLLPGERRRRRADPGVRPSGRGTCSQPPAYLLGVAQGSEHRNAARGAQRARLYATSSFTTVAPHLYEMAGSAAKDVDVVQSYENFTGGVLMSLVEHGFFTAERGQRVPHAREPAGAERASCRSTPAAATWPSATCTASSCRSRRCARSAASRPRRCPARDVVDGDLGPDGDAGRRA